jgi:hypothetical protein
MGRDERGSFEEWRRERKGRRELMAMKVPVRPTPALQ